jgi:hypothetical protein
MPETGVQVPFSEHPVLTLRRARRPRLALVAVVVAFAVWLPSPSVALSYNFGPTVTQTGPEETVFDWTTMRCEEWDIPDSSSRAFWDAQGRTQLISTHFPGRRMIGSNLD